MGTGARSAPANFDTLDIFDVAQDDAPAPTEDREDAHGFVLLDPVVGMTSSTGSARGGVKTVGGSRAKLEGGL